MAKLNIERMSEVLGNLNLDASFSFYKRKSDLDITVISSLVMEIAIIYRIMLHNEFIKASLNGTKTLSDEQKKYIDEKNSLVFKTYEITDNEKLIGQFKEIHKHVTDMKEYQVSDYFKDDNRIAINSKSDEHLDAFGVRTKADLPVINFVIKFKNFSGDRMHIRVGVKLDRDPFVEAISKLTFQIWDVTMKS